MVKEDMMMAGRVAEAVQRAGGRVYYVGGFVRDRLLGRENKDIDIEVHGIPVRTLEEILDSLGERLTMGASFGVMGLRHYDLDIAMPRSETATGRGHKDFEVFVDPFLGEEKAAMRRDFTINALMEDVLSGEILDFFGGREDLKRGLIRHVNDESFAEDPLRVFRACQFAARFQFAVAPETTALCSTMSVDALAKERILGEMEKALLKAASPSVFFEELRKMRQLSFWFPELEALIGLEQNAQYHSEGDVWTHTMQVLDEAALLRGEAREPLWFMLSALCHDFGKAVTTEEKDGVIHAYAHETAGLPLVERFLSRVANEVKLKEYVLDMTRMHMIPNMLAVNTRSAKKFMKMFDSSVCPEDLLLLAKADHLGRQTPDTDRTEMLREYQPIEEQLLSRLADYRRLMDNPPLMGRDLIEAGMTPGPIFTDALAYAHKLHLAGIPKETALRQTLGMYHKTERTEKHDAGTDAAPGSGDAAEN